MPDQYSAAIYTLGCKVNQYESEAIAESLERYHIRICDFREICDLYFINTCAVTSESVRKARQIIRRAKKTNPEAYILVMGCAAQLDAVSVAALDVDYICGTRNKMSAVTAALKLLSADGRHGEPVIAVGSTDSGFEPMEIRRFERTRAYVKIQDGCNSHCAYCIIPAVRGNVVSRQRDDILREVRTLAGNGCREVVLTGIETSAYEYDLAALLCELEAVDGLERIRLGSLDPSFMRRELVDRIAGLSKTAPHFHLSMQSGCNRTLNRMRRKYSCETAARNIAYIRQVMPGVNFSTDIMTGFPGETEVDFSETLSFMRSLRFLHMHIFTYSRRPGTEADTMPDQVPEEIKIRRSRRLEEADRAIRAGILAETAQKKVPLSVLFETEQDGFLSGHTPNFIEVTVPVCSLAEEKSLRGRIREVCPLSSDENKIIGTLL